MSNVTPINRTKKTHIPTAAPAPTTVTKPDGQVALSDNVVGKRTPPEPTSETLGLQGGAQIIAAGKGNLRMLQRGDTLEITVHAVVVEDGNRDKLGKDDAVSDTVRKVLAKITRFDEVKVLSNADVDTVAEVVADRESCFDCDGRGVIVIDGSDTDPCGSCGGDGSVVKKTVDVPAEPKALPAGDAPADDDGVMFGQDTAPAETVATNVGLMLGQPATYTEANLTAKGITKADLHAVLGELIDGDVPPSTTKAKAVEGILRIVTARAAADRDEATSEPDAQTGDVDTNGDVVDESVPAGDVEIEEPTVDVPADEPHPAGAAGMPGEPDEYVTGKVIDIADDGSDIAAQLDGDGFRVFVHARSGQAFDTLPAAKAGPKADGEGSDPVPAPEVDPEPAPQVEGSGMTVDEASALTDDQLATMDEPQLRAVSAALGVDATHAASLNKKALIAVIEREQIPF